MLNQKICLVDFSERAYGFNHLYTEVMPRAQVNLLYLATALSVRPNRVTVLSARADQRQDAGISFAPLPADPARYWAEAGFDTVICLDSLAGADEIAPYLPAGTPLVLWSHLPARHIAMLPLEHARVREAFSAFVFQSFYELQRYHELYRLPAEKLCYRWPAIIRSLRKRFSSSDQLAAARAPRLTMAFTADPAFGLAQTLEIFATLKRDLPELCLRILLKPGFDAATAAPGVSEALALARETPDTELLDPVPWPGYVEKLLGCHLLCHPMAAHDPGSSELIDALGAGCLTALGKDPALVELDCDQVEWVEPEPAEDYLSRYREAIAGLLAGFRDTPGKMIERSFRQIAKVNTHFTWDLRVWEWESLCFRLQRPDQTS